MQKKGFLIVAHGSRREESNHEVIALANALATRAVNVPIRVAFLENCNPTLGMAIDALVKEDILKISVFPYFLGGGIHVTHDIPVLLEEKRLAYRDCGIVIQQLPHLGTDPDLLALLARKVENS